MTNPASIKEPAAMEAPSQDLLQAARALLPSLIGVLFGVFARWARAARAGRVKSIWRLVVLDLPTLGALTLVAGNIAGRMSADPLTSAGIGVAAGYIGIEALDAFVSWRMRSISDASQQSRG